MSGILSFLRSPSGLVALAVAAAMILYGWREVSRQLVPPSPPLPEILRGATAGGGPSISCETVDVAKVAYSPEIVARLRYRFPSGSRASVLHSYLRSEGFTIILPCPQDKLLHLAIFEQKRGGGMSYPARAEIWWKDDGTSLAWVTANIAYTGL